MQAKTKLALSLLSMAAVFMIGTAGYTVIEKSEFLDSAYATALVISTVGFNEPWPFSAAGKIWTIFVAAFGVGAVLLAFSSLQALVTGGEMRRLLGRRRLDNKIAGLQDHYIICGYGRMGKLVCDALVNRQVPTVIVENDPATTAAIEEQDRLYVLGDASDEQVLSQANVAGARGLVAVLPRDSDNVYITLSARGLNPGIYIVARAEQPSTESKLLQAGANRVICPSIIGAQRITNLLIKPNVLEFVDIAAEGVDLEVDEMTLTGSSPLLGKTLAQSGLREKVGGIVVAIKSADGQTRFSPTAQTVLNENDTLILIGPSGISAAIASLT